MIKPDRLKIGDKVATVSLSWGGAGDDDLLWRYNLGKRRLEELGLEVVEMENTLKGSEYIYNNPEKRAEDLMKAFKDSSVKAIFSNIGGEDSIRILPYIDFDIIKDNPKIFLGYSDSTITHLICHSAGLTSFFGPSILAEFAENIEIFPYTLEYFKKALFNTEPIGNILQSEEWTAERIEWEEKNKDIKKIMIKNTEYDFLQGQGIVSGRLFGGCMEVLEMAKGTILWDNIKDLKDTILFFETSENEIDPNVFKCWLRNYGAQGILQNSNGIIFGKPQNETYYDEYRENIKTIVNEFNLHDIPIVLNMSFGHNEPMFTIPYGVMAEINCDSEEFHIIEAGVK